MANENPPPKLLGGLLASLGLVMAFAGARLSDMESGGSYYVTVGICLALSGALLYLGKKLALAAYAVTVAVVWIWALKNSTAPGDWVPQVMLPTLIGFYIFSSRVRERLY